MHRQKIDIRFSRLFPWHFMFLAVVVFIIALGLIIKEPIIAIGLMLTAGFVLTGYSGTEINRGKKTYKEYNSFFFFIKSGKEMTYTGIEKLFITRSKVSQKMYSRTSQSSTFTNIEFNAYIKFEDGLKIQLLNNAKKEKVVSSLKKIAAFLQVNMEDHTVAAG